MFDFNTAIIASVTLYAKWTINLTVTFNTDDGSSVDNQTITSGNKATKPTNPTKAGYTFVDWYKDATLTSVFDFNTAIIASVTLYAKWTINLTVTFNTDRGSAVESQTITSGGKATKPSTNPTKAGYTFDNWYKDEAKTTIFNFETETITTNITLYAKWTINLTVTFNTDRGSAVESQTITSGGKATKPSTNPTKAGYTFDNWYKDEAKTTIFNFETETITTNITLYANWNAIPISSISLPSAASVDLKATLQLTATFSPADVLDKSLTWTSSDNAIATVSSTGLVTGLNSGTATITATSATDNTKQATLTLTVTTYFTIPDANFREELKKKFYQAFHTEQNDKMDVSNTYVKDFTGKIDVASKSISSLSGIEYFTKLTVLYCNSNRLTSLDLSKNTALTTIHCNSNQLTSLDLSKNTSLTTLLCYSNQLTSLDVSKNTALTTLACNSNQLVSLDLSMHTALTELRCESNWLRSLDLSKNTALRTLVCHTNDLMSLDMRGMRSVDIFFIISSGRFTNNSRLTSIKIHRSVTSTNPDLTLNSELIKVRAAVVEANSANYAQIDSYTSTGTPSVTYTADICDCDPSTWEKVAESTKVCKP